MYRQGVADRRFTEPVAGDVSVCAACGAHLIYTDNDFGMRLLTDVEFERVPASFRHGMEAATQYILGNLDHSLHPRNRHGC